VGIRGGGCGILEDELVVGVEALLARLAVVVEAGAEGFGAMNGEDGEDGRAVGVVGVAVDAQAEKALFAGLGFGGCGEGELCSVSRLE